MCCLTILTKKTKTKNTLDKKPCPANNLEKWRKKQIPKNKTS